MKIFTHNFIGKIGLMLVALAFACCLPAMGQVVKGSLSGTVTDPEGAMVGGAQVKATQIATGAVFTTASDSSGLFRINLIPAGAYKVEISSQGFKTAVQSNVQVTAGADLGLGTLKLALGEANTTVEVLGGEAPLIEASQAQVTNTFSGTTLQTFSGIQENQGLDNLALFVPGVASSRDNNFANTNGGQGFSANGLRGRSNDQEVDGQNNNDNEVTGPALFVTDPNFVQQYVIITNNFGAEYGRNAGSVVNLITASGTNSLHGSVYGTENNSILNGETEDQKTNGLVGPPRGNDEFAGGTIGMPWIKNKLFFFGGFDQEIVSTATSFTGGLTPTPAGLATLAGCFPTGTSANAVANLTKFGPYGISAGNPAPTGTPTLTNITDPFTGATLCSNVQEAGVGRLLSTPVHDYNFVIHQDWQASANDMVSGRYLSNRSFTGNISIGTEAAAGYPENVPALSQATLISWTHNFNARMVNEARIGYDRLNVQFGGNSIGNTVPTPGNITEAFPSVAFLDGVTQPLGPASNAISSRFVNTWQGQDNWNYVWGKHQLKAGVNYTHQQTPSTFLPGIDGIYNFASLSAYIVNQPSSALITLGNPEVGFKEDDTFLYVGDDWKIKPNLTLNLGLTWSYFSQPSNVLNQLTTANETGPNPLFNPALPLSIRTFPALSAYPYTIGPSFGFAYSPQWGGALTGQGKTVIRGGYRVSYDPGNLNVYLNNYDSAPSTLAAVIPGANLGINPATPAPANLQIPLNPTGVTVAPLLTQSIAVGQLDPRNFPEGLLPSSYRPDQVQEWSLGIERELSKHAALEVRYVGNHGSQLLMNVNANPYIGVPGAAAAALGENGLAQSFPNLVPAGVTPCTDPTAPGFGRVNCNMGLVQLRTNDGFSNYNGLQVNFRANSLFRQLTMTASYTYSKTMDNAGEIFSTLGAGNTVDTAQNPFNIKGAEYSLSGINFPNNFTVQLTEQLPFFREQHGLIGHLLGGWAGSLDYIFTSGQPYTPDMVSLAGATDFAAGLGDIYDSNFDNAFIGFGNARPFLGNPSAPTQNVGIFCGDVNGCTASGIAANQLISLNALNGPNGGSMIPVSNQQVRFIANTATAQLAFGTPFGNMPRNYLTDNPINTGNISIFKNFKLSERATFEFHVTMLNAFNHNNFAGVDPFIESAGAAVSPFATPSQDLDLANGLTNEIPGQTLPATRRIFFGGKITF